MRRLFPVLLLALTLPLAVPARSESTYGGGFYRMMTGGTTPAAVAQLQFFPSVGTSPRILVTVLNPQGGYRLLYGQVERGGLNILYARLHDVTKPFAFLQVLDPTSLLADYNSFLGAEICEFYLYTGPAYYDFSCSSFDPTHPSSSQGRLERLPS